MSGTVLAIKLSTRAQVSADPSRVVVTRYVRLPDGSTQTESLDHFGGWQARPKGFEYAPREGFVAGAINRPDGSFETTPRLEDVEVFEQLEVFKGWTTVDMNDWKMFSDPTVSDEAVLAPVVEWLNDRGVERHEISAPAPRVLFFRYANDARALVRRFGDVEGGRDD